MLDRLEAAVASTEDAVDLAIVDIDDFSDLALGKTFWKEIFSILT